LQQLAKKLTLETSKAKQQDLMESFNGPELTAFIVNTIPWRSAL